MNTCTPSSLYDLYVSVPSAFPRGSSRRQAQEGNDEKCRLMTHESPEGLSSDSIRSGTSDFEETLHLHSLISLQSQWSKTMDLERFRASFALDPCLIQCFILSAIKTSPSHS